MGVSIAYRGQLADLTRIEDFEDRLLDLALAVGGMAQIWRSPAGDDPQRLIRGVLLNLVLGQEPVSMLLSPEGWLIGLTDIDDAAGGRLTEPPWCITKTQFGSLEGHVALVEMLTALRREFVPDLEAADEGGYWESRDLSELVRRRALVQQAINSLAEALQQHGLSREAVEDEAILLHRIERVASQAQRTLQRPAEHPPVTIPEDESASQDPEAIESLWDERFKQNRRQQEWVQRALEERRSSGADEGMALEEALLRLSMEVPGEDHPPEASPSEEPEFLDPPFAEEPLGEVDDEDWKEEERHPLLSRATDLYLRLHRHFADVDRRLSANLHTLFQGLGDVMGGLAQAMSGRQDDEDNADDNALRITQLKRALRGTAFARGGLLPLRAAGSAEETRELQAVLRQLEQDIWQEIGQLRSDFRVRGGQ